MRINTMLPSYASSSTEIQETEKLEANPRLEYNLREKRGMCYGVFNREEAIRISRCIQVPTDARFETTRVPQFFFCGKIIIRIYNY